MKNSCISAPVHAFMLAAIALPSMPLMAIDTNGIGEYRSIDGTFNHQTLPDLGRSNLPLLRFAPAAYGDGNDLPRGVPVDEGDDGLITVDEQTDLPAPRLVSNLVHDQGEEEIPSGRRLNQLVFQFGQFLSHDTSLAEPNASTDTGDGTDLSGNEAFNVLVSTEDPVFDFTEIPATRSVSVAASASPTGQREQINTLTAWIDGSQVYGSDEDRAAAIREYEGGLLKWSDGPDGELMPYNTLELANVNALQIPESQMFAAGDVRANEQVGLIGMHTLWLREHNRAAREIAETDFYGEDLSDPDTDEEIYQRARAVVVALLQKITYYEWLPALIGYGTLTEYNGYDSSVNPEIANEFTTAAFRIGHTMLPPVYRPTDYDGGEDELSLLDAFFNPDYITDNGIDNFLRGQATHRQQEIDRFVVGEVRNFLFGPTVGGLDLPALNIQRGRDHGLADVNTVRDAYGLYAYGDLLELTGDPEAAEALEQAYGSDGVDLVDLWTAGLCEPALLGTNLGETFTTLFIDQFTRLRDGDRFYFENEEVYSYEFIEEIRSTTFADVIRRNTSIEGDQVNDYAFFEPYYHPFQPDCRIGRDADYSYHQGDDVYNQSGDGQSLVLTGKARRTSHLHISLENDGAFYNHLVFSVGALPRKASLACYDMNNDRSNVTAEMMTGLHEPVLEPGEIREHEIHVRAGKAKRGKRIRGSVRFQAEHYYDGWGSDVVTARLNLR
jgi:hypothetical protein